LIGVVLLKNDNEIDCLQRRQYFRPRTLVLNRAPRAFSRLAEASLFQADDQAIAGAARRGQNLDVAGMQNIEAAVGESEPAVPVCANPEMRFEVAAGCNDLFFGCEGGMR